MVVDVTEAAASEGVEEEGVEEEEEEEEAGLTSSSSPFFSSSHLFCTTALAGAKASSTAASLSALNSTEEWRVMTMHFLSWVCGGGCKGEGGGWVKEDRRAAMKEETDSSLNSPVKRIRCQI